MLLTVWDRVSLIERLKGKGKIIEKLKFNPEEQKKYGIVVRNDGRLFWNKKKDEAKDIKFNKDEEEIIRKVLKGNLDTWDLPISHRLFPHPPRTIPLTIFDRVSILSILPTTGDYEALKAIEQIRMVLGVADDEFKLLGIHQRVDGKLVWNEKYNTKRLYQFSEKQWQVIKQAFNKVSNEGRLTYGQLKLYERFHTTQV